MRFIAGALLALLGSQTGAVSSDPGSDLLRRNVQFEQLSTAEGLSHEMVYDVEQDASGFLWIATQDGLGRFDGHEVETFYHLRTDAGTLSNDFVRTLFRDSRGRLWIGTEGGANLYLEADRAFLRQPFPDADGSLLDHSVRAIVESPDGRIWFGTAGGGLVGASADGSALQVFGPESSPSLPAASVLSIEIARDGALWVGTEGAGLLRFDPDRGAFERPPGLAALAETSVRALHEDDSGHLWIGTDSSGAARLDPTTGTLTRLRHDPEQPGSLPNPRVRSIHEDQEGTLWIATDGGLAEWREATDAFVTYHQRDGDERSLASDRVNSLFTDQSGVLWVGTWNGLSRWNHLSDVFSYFSVADGQLPGEQISSVAEDSVGTLWVATYGSGLGRLDPGSGDLHVFRHSPGDPASLPEDRVMIVHVDSRDRVWVGTRAAGLARLDPGTDRFVRFRHDEQDPASLSADAVASILEGPRGDLWVGTFGAGLNRLRGGEGNRFERFVPDPENPRSIGGGAVLTLVDAGDDRLWVGTLGEGLDLFDIERSEFDHFRSFAIASETESALELDTITDLLRASDGSLWIATLGQGLLRWSPEAQASGTAEVSIFDRTLGMPGDAIYGVLEDADGAIWSSSNRGLVRLEPGRNTLRLFDDRNGLRDSEFNSARARTRSGHLLFGGPEGLVRFRADELPFNERPPAVVLTASSRDTHLARSNTFDASPTVEIGHLDPFLAFDFVALDFVSPDKNRYRYRMAGFDPDWVEPGAFRRAAYTNLPAGRYVFEVQAANNDGVWNEIGASIQVLVIPAPWNSLWAYAIYVMAALTAVGLYLRAQREKLSQESRQRVLLEEQVEQRTRELAQSNRDLHRLNERLEEAAVTDSLTGLRNRRYADRFLASEISKFEREQLRLIEAARDRGEAPPSRSMFLMMIDLDGFKTINDQFGHHAGDRVLVQMKEILIGTCRASDTIIRWGGDEFLIAGTTTDYGDVKILAQRIRDAIARRAFDVGGDRTATLSASVGVSPYPLVPDRYSFCNWELVSAVADQAAYVAKASGRNAWVSIVGTDTLSPEMLTGLSERLGTLVEEGALEIETELTSALRTAHGALIERPPSD